MRTRKGPEGFTSSNSVSVWPSWPCWSAWRLRASALVCGRRPFVPPLSSCWLACSKRVPAPSCRRGRQISARVTRPEIASPHTHPPPTGVPPSRPNPPGAASPTYASRGRGGARFPFAAQVLARCAERKHRHPNYLRHAGHRGAPRHRAEPERPPAPRRIISREMPVMRSAQGFTLVETLVALVVLSVGLLGAAAMLLDSLRSHPARCTRRRPPAWCATWPIAFAQIRAPALTTARTSSVPTSACDEASGCDSAQLAAADLAHLRPPRAPSSPMRKSSSRGIRARHRPRHTSRYRIRCAGPMPQCRHTKRRAAGAGAVAGGGLRRGPRASRPRFQSAGAHDRAHARLVPGGGVSRRPAALPRRVHCQ